MNRHLASNVTRARLASLLLVALFLAPPVFGQQPSQNKLAPNAAATGAPAASDAKAEQVIARAVEAVGGVAFLGVQTVVSRGFYSQYKDGLSLPPATFTDYFVFPDRERTEFKARGIRNVQTFMGTEGWLYNGEHKKLIDAGPEHLKDFRTAVRTSIDNALRGWWRKEGARLAYVGRREAGLARRNEVVRLTYPDGFAVEFEFGAKDGLPYKVRYKQLNAEGEETEEEDRFAQHLSVGGVTLPFVIDHYRAGAQTSRINYEAYEFNRPVADTLFARPADVKAFLKTLK